MSIAIINKISHKIINDILASKKYDFIKLQTSESLYDIKKVGEVNKFIFIT